MRVRDKGLVGAVFARDDDRSASFALGGNGTAKGDGVCGMLPAANTVGVETVRLEGDKGDGESGDLGDSLGDLVTRRNLDGDRDSERRSDLTADVTST